MEKFIHGFNLVNGGNFVSQNKILRHFRDWEYAWEKGVYEEFVRAGLTTESAGKIIAVRGRIDVDLEYERLYENDIFLITQKSGEYPAILKEAGGAPIALYRKGAPLSESARHVAVVGTRKMSAYGGGFAGKVGEMLALNNVVIVSGLAFGVDAAAHFAAVKNGRSTVAVLASGLIKITPAAHYFLAEKILGCGGTLISEYAGDGDSYKGRYLERNRIISGLCEATIVVEAPQKSGALITARYAVEQGREVYALVGDIGREQSEGCLRLIEKGEAYGIYSVDGLAADLKLKTVLEMVGSAIEAAGGAGAAGGDAASVLRLIRQEPVYSDRLCEITGRTPAEISVILTKLEMAGLVKKSQNNCWTARG
jgi:DNA processing protein